MALSCPFQIGDHLAHSAAGVQSAQPCRGVGISIVRGFLLLQIHQHHRHTQIPNGGEHIVGRGVGQKLHDDQVHVSRPELVPGSGGLLLGGDQTAVDQFHGIRDALLEVGILAFKLRHQLRELGQVRP